MSGRVAAGPTEGARSTEGRAGAGVPAWDGPTRLFKWTLVLLVLNAYLTYLRGDAGIGWHIWNGYAVLILLAFRVIWGFAGSSTARFRAWVVWPWTALAYAFALMAGRGRKYLGHNPLGAWMIIALLLLALAQGLTGLFTVDNNGLEGGPFANLDFGDPTPLQRTLSRWHHLGFYVLLGFAVVHVAVNLWYDFAKRDPVIRAMIKGSKPEADYADQPRMVRPSHVWLRAGASLAAAATLVLGGVKAFGGKLPF